jgi:hypothetical protein
MKRRHWKIGSNAGGAFLPNGDLWIAHWVTSPKGEQLIRVTVCGFRDTPEGRQKVILDRRLTDPPHIVRKN